MKRTEHLLRDLPDPDAARRFLTNLEESHPAQLHKLQNTDGLLSDVLTLVSFSPLLAATLLQNPEYFWWLNKRRIESGVRGKDELLESLARFTLTNSQLEPQVLYARFRRRELLRIFLRDIRRLATIAEVTEEISNLADAILETALEAAKREISNRFGTPQEPDGKGRLRPATFCVAALGKLGSKELNYSSDIDLLFLYSNEGTTSGAGSRGSVTNREYFVKLAEHFTKLVGQQTGEGAAYRVDLRLRPHGSLGALALSVADTVKYYKTEAREWERQVLIRSRGCAGNKELYKKFFDEVESLIFPDTETVETALANVRRSKERIDLENINRRGYDVKLGRGGIREIEFLAQALQLAHGGRDKWLRREHTLISLARLADRKHLSSKDLTELSSAYEFLRRTEHILQMENGVQTHTVPDDVEKRGLIARKMEFAAAGSFEAGLKESSENVHRIFRRVFGELQPLETTEMVSTDDLKTGADIPDAQERTRQHVLASIEKSDVTFDPTGNSITVLDRLTAVSPHFASMIASNPQLAAELPDPDKKLGDPDYDEIMSDAVDAAKDFGSRLAAMRRAWSRCLLEIVVHDIFEKIDIQEARRLQTGLAEASIAAAVRVVRDALAEKYGSGIEHLDLAILALGKLGGRGLDYDSDLDLVIVYFDETGWRRDKNGELILRDRVSSAEFYSRAVELFSTTLSSMTRDGNLYRVDLRLRPFGSKGLTAISIDAFLNYMQETAAVWEMLAFIKLRAVGGDLSLGQTVENETRRVIHERALTVDRDELREETRRVRIALENQRRGPRHSTDIDIKYGEGGMLDVYFAMRYLQLRDNIPEDPSDRSTVFMLERLRSSGSLSDEQFTDLLAGYRFLSTLDHNLRLTVGRTTRVPVANTATLGIIAHRMNINSAVELLEQLTLHRLAIRGVFIAVLK